MNALIVLTDRFVVVLRLIGIGAGLQDRWQFIVNVFGLLILSRNARPLGGRRVRLFLSFSGVSCCAPTRHSAIVRGFDLVERQGVAVARLKREIVLWMLADLNVGVVVGARARCAGRDCVSADERNADVHVLTILIGLGSVLRFDVRAIKFDDGVLDRHGRAVRLFYRHPAARGNHLR